MSNLSLRRDGLLGVPLSPPLCPIPMDRLQGLGGNPMERGGDFRRGEYYGGKYGNRNWTERRRESQSSDRSMTVRQSNLMVQGSVSMQRRVEVIRDVNRPRNVEWTRIQPREESCSNRAVDDDVICIGEQTCVAPPFHGLCSDKRKSGKLSEQLDRGRTREETNRSGNETRKKSGQEEKDVVIMPVTRDAELPSKTTLTSPSMKQSEITKQNEVEKKQGETKNDKQSLIEDKEHATGDDRETTKAMTSSKDGQSNTGETNRENQQLVVSELETKSNKEGRRGEGNDTSLVASQETTMEGLEQQQDKDTEHTEVRTRVGDESIDTDTPVEQQSQQTPFQASSLDGGRSGKPSVGVGTSGNESGKAVAVEEEEKAMVSDDDEHEDFEELILKKELIQQELQKISEKEAAAVGQQREQEKAGQNPQEHSREQEQQQQAKRLLKRNRRARARVLKKERIQQELQKISEEEAAAFMQQRAQEKGKQNPQKLSREQLHQAKRLLMRNRRARARSETKARRKSGMQQQTTPMRAAGERFVRDRLESDVAAFLEKGVLPIEGMPAAREKDKKENESSGGEDEEERLRQQLLKSIERKEHQTESQQMAAREESGPSVTGPVAGVEVSKESTRVVPSVPMATHSSMKQTGAGLKSKPEVTSSPKMASKVMALPKQATKKPEGRDSQKGSFVIEVNANDSDSDIDVQEVEHLQAKQQATNLTFSGLSLEEKIKQLRKSSEQSNVEKSLKRVAVNKPPLTPDSIAHLPREKLEEYRRLRIEIVNRERKRKQQQPTKSLSKRPKTTGTQVLPHKPKPGSKSFVLRKQPGSRIAGQSKALTASAKKQVNSESIRVSGEMHAAALCTRLAAETSVLTGKVDKLKLLREQLMDAFGEAKHSCETVQELQSSVKRLGKRDQQEMLDRSKTSVQRAVAMMGLLSEMVRGREATHVEEKMSDDTSEDGGKLPGLKSEVLWQLKVTCYASSSNTVV